MPPEPVSNPHRRFVLTQTVASVETNVAVGALLPSGYTTDQAQRVIAYDSVRSLRDANPTIQYRLYGPTAASGSPHTDGDCIWDSSLNGGAL